MGTVTVTGRDELGRIIDVTLTTTADVPPPGPEVVSDGGGSLTVDNGVDPPAEVSTIVALADLSTPGTAALEAPFDVEWAAGVTADYATSLENAVQVSVHWGADGSITLNRGSSSIGFTATGEAVISRGNSTIEIGADDTIQLLPNGGPGVEVDPDGTVTIGGAVVIVNDASTTISTGVVSILGLPTADPTAAGQLWSDAGTVKVSAG